MFSSHKLFDGLLNGLDESLQNLQLSMVTTDSRLLRPGGLFVLFRRENVSFIFDALARGASIIIAPASLRPELGSVKNVIFHPDPKEVYHVIASRCYPKQPDMIAAVTGTKGKGSVIHILQSIMNSAGHKMATIGSMGVSDYPGNFIIPSAGWLTTPDPIDLHYQLDNLMLKGFDCIALEASSHGLFQSRLDSVVVSAAAVTNFSHDHLDFHGDKDSYLRAKQLLFSKVLRADGVAIINSDLDADISNAFINAAGNRKIIWYGWNAKEVELLSQEATEFGQILEYSVNGIKYATKLSLLGAFQGHNFLCAIAFSVALGIDFNGNMAGDIPVLRGRMELLKLSNNLSVIVDFSHTPASLESAITSLRWHGFERVVVVFGCGGNRDRTKRMVMGQIAEVNADFIVVCDDNPRYEDPASIRAEILSGISSSGRAIEIGDRKKAIAFAIESEIKSVVKTAVLIAGKGAECEQIIRGERIPFSDRAIVEDYII